MRCRPIPSWKDLPRNNERGGIRSEVLEEVAETIERKQSSGRDNVKSESDNTKKDSKDEKSTDLNGLASNGVDRCYRNPIPRNEASARQNKIANTIVVQPGLAKKSPKWRTFCKWYPPRVANSAKYNGSV